MQKTNISLKKHHMYIYIYIYIYIYVYIYIFIGYIIGWVRFKAPSMFISKRSSKFETLLAKIFSLRTKTKIKYIELL